MPCDQTRRCKGVVKSLRLSYVIKTSLEHCEIFPKMITSRAPWRDLIGVCKECFFSVKTRISFESIGTLLITNVYYLDK